MDALNGEKKRQPGHGDGDDGNTRFTIEHKAYSRVGLLGNPSDVYYGRTISFTLGNFWATVRLCPSDNLIIQPHPSHDFVQFPSIDSLFDRVEREGYYGGVRLLMAICKVFYKYCKENNINLKSGNFTLSYDTNIPRQFSNIVSKGPSGAVFDHGLLAIMAIQTGLSGSSAIVCAALNCLLDFYMVRHLIKVEIRPNLVLSAENELGIVAGLQDRVAQVYGGLVYMDFSKQNMDDLGHGLYMSMDTSLLPPLHVIYAENPSDSGKVHSSVRKRWLDGDEFIISSMKQVAILAAEGHMSLLRKDYTRLAELMNQNFDLRRSMFGNDVLGSMNISMVEVARSVGAAAKFTGSGGAVIAFCPDGPSQAKRLEEACHRANFVILPAIVVPCVLNDEDLKMLSH